MIGSWPARPGLAERENQADLEVVAGGPLAGLLPEGASALDRQAFLAVATAGLIPSLGGTRGRALNAPLPQIVCNLQHTKHCLISLTRRTIVAIT